MQLSKVLSICTVLLFISFASFSQYISNNNRYGAWEDNSTWAGNNAPSNNIQGGRNVEISGTVLADANINIREWFGGGKLTILEGDTLVITGTLDIQTGGDLVIEKDAYLIVLGDFYSFGFPDVNNGGNLLINGDARFPGWPGTKPQNNGNMEINGSVTNQDRIDGSGTVSNALSPDNQSFVDDLLKDPVEALPIKLKNFEGIVAKNQAKLNWVTAKEENFSHFELERSIDGKAFEIVGIVEGQGNSMTDVHYNFVDQSIPFGNLRYRLKAVDIDDSFEYFEVIEIKNTFSNQVSIYPNPTNSLSNIKIVLPKEFEGGLDKVSLFDASGVNIYNQTNFDHQLSTLDVGAVEKGMYILRIYHNGLTESLRVMVK